MSTTSPRLKLDEQSFQNLLAAAFTIQEHYERKRQAAVDSASKGAPSVEDILESLCPHCAAPIHSSDALCPQCGLERLRPGERMQSKLASFWEMSREQGVRHNPADAAESVFNVASSEPGATSNADREVDRTAEVQEPESSREKDWFNLFPELSDQEPETASIVETAIAELENASDGTLSEFRRWWQQLNLGKADIYLGLAIVVAALALVWPASTSPPTGRLEPWQRILVKLGIAEAPPPAIHYRGNPNVKVWVDSHTALYYCPGEEQYGKTADGRFAAQREAQLDQFQPANRTVCP